MLKSSVFEIKRVTRTAILTSLVLLTILCVGFTLNSSYADTATTSNSAIVVTTTTSGSAVTVDLATVTTGASIEVTFKDGSDATFDESTMKINGLQLGESFDVKVDGDVYTVTVNQTSAIESKQVTRNNVSSRDRDKDTSDNRVFAKPVDLVHKNSSSKSETTVEKEVVTEVSEEKDTAAKEVVKEDTSETVESGVINVNINANQDDDIALDIQNPKGGTQLPKTGESTPKLPLVGVIISAVGLYVLKRKM